MIYAAVLLLALPFVNGGNQPYKSNGGGNWETREKLVTDADQETKDANIKKFGSEIHDSKLFRLWVTDETPYETGGALGLWQEKEGGQWRLLYGALRNENPTKVTAHKTADAMFGWTNGGKIKVVMVTDSCDGCEKGKFKMVEGWSNHRMCLSFRNTDERMPETNSGLVRLSIESCSANTHETSMGCLNIEKDCMVCGDEQGNPKDDGSCSPCNGKEYENPAKMWDLLPKARILEVLRNQRVMSEGDYDDWFDDVIGKSEKRLWFVASDETSPTEKGPDWDCGVAEKLNSGPKAYKEWVGKDSRFDVKDDGEVKKCSDHKNEIDESTYIWLKNDCDDDKNCKWVTTLNVGDGETGKCMELNAVDDSGNEIKWQARPPKIDKPVGDEWYTVISKGGRFLTFRRTGQKNQKRNDRKRVLSWTHNYYKAKVFRTRGTQQNHLWVKNALAGGADATSGMVIPLGQEWTYWPDGLEGDHRSDEYACLYHGGQVYYGLKSDILTVKAGDDISKKDFVSGVGGDEDRELCNPKTNSYYTGDFPEDHCRSKDSGIGIEGADIYSHNRIAKNCHTCYLCTKAGFQWDYKNELCAASKDAITGFESPSDEEYNNCLDETPNGRDRYWSPCRSTADCWYKNDSNRGWCNFGHCTYPLEVGEECKANLECYSHFCDPGVQKCKKILLADMKSLPVGGR